MRRKNADLNKLGSEINFDFLCSLNSTSDMFLARNQFSSRTVATVSSLKDPNAKRREDYKWRKEMEE